MYAHAHIEYSSTVDRVRYVNTILSYSYIARYVILYIQDYLMISRRPQVPVSS